MKNHLIGMVGYSVFWVSWIGLSIDMAFIGWSTTVLIHCLATALDM